MAHLQHDIVGAPLSLRFGIFPRGDYVEVIGRVRLEAKALCPQEDVEIVKRDLRNVLALMLNCPSSRLIEVPDNGLPTNT